VTSEDWAWLAGLLEGEGCFSLARDRYPAVSLDMTDRDVVERAAEMMGAPSVCEQPNPGKKTSWRTRSNGLTALAVMVNVSPYLGVRRRAKVREVLDVWEHNPRRTRYEKIK
jgi:hypothetical protein